MDRSATKKLQEQIRFQAIDLFLGGIPSPQIALQLGVSLQAVCLWVRIFRAQGRSGLLAKHQNGHPKLSNPTHLREVQILLENHPRSFGLNKNHWTGPAIVQAMKTKWGIKMHPKSIYRWLDRNGFKGIVGHLSKTYARSLSDPRPEGMRGMGAK